MRIFATKIWLTVPFESGAHDITSLTVGEGTDPKVFYCKKIIVRIDHITANLHTGESIHVPMHNVAGAVVETHVKAGKGTSSVIKPIPLPASV